MNKPVRRNRNPVVVQGSATTVAGGGLIGLASQPLAPTVTVKIPSVKFNIADVAYMRSLSDPNGITCKASDGTLARLELLGLIVRADIPASPQAIAEWRKRERKLTTDIRAAIKARKWDTLSRLASDISWKSRQAAPRSGYRLTDCGRKLLQNGSITVKMQKGCAK